MSTVVVDVVRMTSVLYQLELEEVGYLGLEVQ